jgi:hypothetical protein
MTASGILLRSVGRKRASGQRDSGLRDRGRFMIFVCELGPDWTGLNIHEALKIPRGARDMRCRACHGRITPHKKYSDGVPAHFEHSIKHEGCSLSAYIFSGVPTLHPEALT